MVVNFAQALEQFPVILSECAVSERLRRLSGIDIHPTLFNTPLIYDDKGRAALEDIYLSYIVVARRAKLPILICAPTWRVDRERVEAAGVPKTINGDAVSFMTELKDRSVTVDSEIMVGALLAPKHDCYAPDQALGRRQASEFHGWQIDELAASKADVIVAQTMPAVSESLGMADRLGASGKPYIISFVIDRFGKVLDGTPLGEAMDRIDQAAACPPAGYMVNCVYPSFVDAGRQPAGFFTRMIGIQANASSRDHAELDGAEVLMRDPLPDWCQNMLALNREYGVKILGGCCGTDDTYLQCLAGSLQQ
ncbi:MAG: homocysteine S-methyltransferase family protein [Desulfofustis sp.]|nr:homocysteine S-methyltransferase family protein [Desulfofustis sp.]